MEPRGPKLAEGRDSEIFEHGLGKVLRRARNGRSLEREAAVMRHVREHGYPAPEVFDAGEGWLVMERLEGQDMMDAVPRTPGGVRNAAKQLADLLQQLTAIEAPDWLPPAPGPAGDRVVHLDLHPLNVMSTSRGLVVIDWANARRGDPATDIANTWSLLACGSPPTGLVDRMLVALARGILLRAFLAAVDRDAAKRAMPEVLQWRLQDRNHTDAERRRLARLAG